MKQETKSKYQKITVIGLLLLILILESSIIVYLAYYIETKLRTSKSSIDLKDNCPTKVQPLVFCNKSIEVDGYYYCNIDDVELVKEK